VTQEKDRLSDGRHSIKVPGSNAADFEREGTNANTGIISSCIPQLEMAKILCGLAAPLIACGRAHRAPPISIRNGIAASIRR
jgi:hypothetical protein